MPSGTLYIVATPIGNLADMTARAAQALHSVHLIACEDTRTSRILLGHYQVITPTISLHKFSEARRTATILERLGRGEDVALISDAGTPAVSDPGSRVVRAALEKGYRVVPIPGASSIIAALSVSGMDCSSFVYLGFVPRKDAERRRFFEALRNEPRTSLFFETPRRIAATLEAAADILGERRIVLTRELTKLHEEILPGTPQTVLDSLKTRPSIRGEIVIVVEGASPAESALDLEEVVKSLMQEGLSGKRLALEAQKRYGVGKNAAYQKFLDMKDVCTT
ncbi:MAG: 16S rRNA (cytidine(1402)-2'-O)-methyltransferase [Deltaproteobacteria bacterium]|nr:16S rRNA (cytidine(1402)-2'-O)-methyltransferase [Deltaproteobacteria bacterium]